MKIFWGVYCHGHWYDIAAEMLRCIVCSGLGRHDIEMHVTGSGQHRIALQLLLDDFGVSPRVLWHSNNAFEFHTLHALWNYANERPAGKACYIHSKGTTSPGPASSRWRWMMENFILRQHLSRSQDLDKYSAVGAAYKPDWHCYAGNWWCARNDWLKQRTEPVVSSDRFYYEKWLLRGCDNFLRLGKDCSGGPPYYIGEPHSTYSYFAGQEESYRPGLLIDLSSHAHDSYD